MTAESPPGATKAAHDRRQRQILVGVALMFFAPLGLSFYLYYGHSHWHPGGKVNAGDLVQPARPLPPLALKLADDKQTKPDFLQGKWTFLYVQSGPCDADCSRHLYDTRQVRLALDREMNRVQRVFIADAGCCDLTALRESHPDLIIIEATPAADPLLALLPAAAADPGAAPAAAPAIGARRIYLIDPLGNLMMSYADDARPKGMLEDMKRLLRLSSIG